MRESNDESFDEENAAEEVDEMSWTTGVGFPSSVVFLDDIWRAAVGLTETRIKDDNNTNAERAVCFTLPMPHQVNKFHRTFNNDFILTLYSQSSLHFTSLDFSFH